MTTPDDTAPADRLPTLRSVLLEAGLPAAEIEAADEVGVLGFVAIDRLVLPEPALYDLTELADRTGMAADEIATIWRALGFPELRPGDRVFTELDAEMLAVVSTLVGQDLVDPEIALQMSRVIGWSLARVASALVDALGAEAPPGPRADSPELAAFTATLMPAMPQIIDHVWRRHLQISARTRITRTLAPGDQPDGRAVGFADLVGFTTLSQQVDDHTLAAIVGRFEQIAYDTVSAFGGRVVKMIGDEVMFLVADPTEAVRIGLALAEEYAADEALSDVRVGIAFGPVLEREADVYGPVVNTASRIVNIAFPGSVVTTDEIHEAIGESDDLSWKSLKPRRLKDIGRVPLWSVRPREDDDRSGPRSEVRERRTEARERRLDALEDSGRRGRRRRADRRRAGRDAAPDDAPDRTVEVTGSPTPTAPPE